VSSPKTGLASLLACALVTAPARADGPPPSSVVSLTPPETPTPDLTMPVVGKDNEPVELLPGRHPERVAAFLFGGLAVVGIGVGSAFGALALSQQSSFNAHPTPAGASLGNQDAVVCDVAFGAAVIAGVTSLILFLDPPAHDEIRTPGSAPPTPKPAASFSVAPTLSPHAAGAGFVLRF